MILDGEDAWISWEPGDDRALRAVLPVAGVELYGRRGESWHRAGRRLPGPERPPEAEPVPLARAIFPAPFSVEPPRDGPRTALPLTLGRDGRHRQTTAMHCAVSRLGRWADAAPSAAIAALKGAIRGGHALLLGQGLPSLDGSTRYWGGQLLVPIGFEVRPSLPEAILIEALGRPGREVLRVIPETVGDGESRFAVEAIPLEVFRPLSRAGVRLAMVGATAS